MSPAVVLSPSPQEHVQPLWGGGCQSGSRSRGNPSDTHRIPRPGPLPCGPRELVSHVSLPTSDLHVTPHGTAWTHGPPLLITRAAASELQEPGGERLLLPRVRGGCSLSSRTGFAGRPLHTHRLLVCFLQGPLRPQYALGISPPAQPFHLSVHGNGIFHCFFRAVFMLVFC